MPLKLIGEYDGGSGFIPLYKLYPEKESGFSKP